jgi:hypothetical protein
LSVGGIIRSTWLLYFSQPAHERGLVKAIKARPIRSIVELGAGLSGRTQKVLEVAAWRKECLPLRYTAIDAFDSRPAGQPRLTLKEAFHVLKPTGVKLQLVPGDPFSALSRIANSLAGTDLLLIAIDQDRQSLERAWKYVPRMLSPQALVLLEEPATGGRTIWRDVPRKEIDQLAAAASRSLRRAA